MPTAFRHGVTFSVLLAAACTRSVDELPPPCRSRLGTLTHI